MITLLKWLLLLAIAITLIAFAVANRHGMAISFYPLPYEILLPTYLFAAGFFLLGFVAAVISGGFRRGGQSLRLRTSRKRIDALENEVEGLKQSGGKQIATKP